MKKLRFLVLSLALLWATCPSYAQFYCDTLAYDCGFKASKLICPMSFIAIGTLGLVDKTPQQKFSTYMFEHVNPNYRRIRVDDYIQYLPLTFHLGLGLSGVNTKHSLAERSLAAVTAYVCMAGLTNGLKYSVKELRPDTTCRNSFPSGHTATAFTGAELTRIEYGNRYGCIAYSVATLVGFSRVYNKRHWFHDVVAGAGIGILSARIGYYMLPVWKRCFNIEKKNANITIVPDINTYRKEYGVCFGMNF